MMNQSFGKEEAKVTRDIEKANGMPAPCELKFLGYVMRPVKKRALWYDGSLEMALALEAEFPGRLEAVRDKMGNYLHQMDVITDHGKLRLMPAACLVIGLKGELYPVDADVFDQTYQLDEGT